MDSSLQAALQASADMAQSLAHSLAGKTGVIAPSTPGSVTKKAPQPKSQKKGKAVAMPPVVLVVDQSASTSKEEKKAQRRADKKNKKQKAASAQVSPVPQSPSPPSTPAATKSKKRKHVEEVVPVASTSTLAPPDASQTESRAAKKQRRKARKEKKAAAGLPPPVEATPSPVVPVKKPKRKSLLAQTPRPASPPTPGPSSPKATPRSPKKAKAGSAVDPVYAFLRNAFPLKDEQSIRAFMDDGNVVPAAEAVPVVDIAEVKRLKRRAVNAKRADDRRASKAALELVARAQEKDDDEVAATPSRADKGKGRAIEPEVDALAGVKRKIAAIDETGNDSDASMSSTATGPVRKTPRRRPSQREKAILRAQSQSQPQSGSQASPPLPDTPIAAPRPLLRTSLSLVSKGPPAMPPPLDTPTQSFNHTPAVLGSPARLEMSTQTFTQGSQYDQLKSSPPVSPTSMGRPRMVDLIDEGSQYDMLDSQLNSPVVEEEEVDEIEATQAEVVSPVESIEDAEDHVVPDVVASPAIFALQPPTPVLSKPLALSSIQQISKRPASRVSTIGTATDSSDSDSDSSSSEEESDSEDSADESKVARKPLRLTTLSRPSLGALSRDAFGAPSKPRLLTLGTPRKTPGEKQDVDEEFEKLASQSLRKGKVSGMLVERDSEVEEESGGSRSTSVETEVEGREIEVKGVSGAEDEDEEESTVEDVTEVQGVPVVNGKAPVDHSYDEEDDATTVEKVARIEEQAQTSEEDELILVPQPSASKNPRPSLPRPRMLASPTPEPVEISTISNGVSEDGGSPISVGSTHYDALQSQVPAPTQEDAAVSMESQFVRLVKDVPLFNPETQASQISPTRNGARVVADSPTQEWANNLVKGIPEDGQSPEVESDVEEPSSPVAQHQARSPPSIVVEPPPTPSRLTRSASAALRSPSPALYTNVPPHTDVSTRLTEARKRALATRDQPSTVPSRVRGTNGTSNGTPKARQAIDSIVASASQGTPKSQRSRASAMPSLSQLDLTPLKNGKKSTRSTAALASQTQSQGQGRKWVAQRDGDGSDSEGEGGRKGGKAAELW